MSAATVPPTPAKSNPPVWKKSAVWRLLVIALLAEIGYAVLNISTMPVYLRADPGTRWIPDGRAMGASVIGFILVAFLFSEAVFKSPMGTLADKYGHKRFMFVGPVMTTCTSLVSVILPHQEGALEVLLFVILRVIDGVGAAMLWPAAFSLMGSSVEDEERQQAMSLLNLCYMIGIAVAMPIGGLVNDMSGRRWASLILSACLFACVAVAVWVFVPSKEKPHAAAQDEHAIGWSDFLASAKAIPGYLMLAVVVFAGIGFPMAIVKPFAEDEFGMTETQFGFLVFPAVALMATLSVPLSKFGERIGKARATHWGIGLCAAGLAFVCLGAFIPIFRMSWALAVGCIPLGIGFLLAIPAWMASVSEIDPERRGANIGAVMTAQGLGAIIGAPIGSALYEKLQPAAPELHEFQMRIAHYSPFFGCAICVFFGWLLSLRLLHNQRESS